MHAMCRTALLTLLLVLCCLQVGCSRHSSSLRPTSTPPNPEGPTTGSVEPSDRADILACRNGLSTAPDRAGDLRIGDLSYVDAQDWARKPPPKNVRQADGSYFYKVGVTVHNDAVITVSIAPAARRFAAIVTTGGPPEGFHTVTYVGCEDRNPAFVGGFLLKGRDRACLPATEYPHARTARGSSCDPLGLQRKLRSVKVLSSPGPRVRCPTLHAISSWAGHITARIGVPH